MADAPDVSRGQGPYLSQIVRDVTAEEDVEVVDKGIIKSVLKAILLETSAVRRGSLHWIVGRSYESVLGCQRHPPPPTFCAK